MRHLTLPTASRLAAIASAVAFASATGAAHARQAAPLAGTDPAGWQVPAEALRAVPSTSGDSFGAFSAMNREGTVLVVGAPNTKLNNTNGVGSIHIFERNAEGEWAHVEQVFCPLTILPGGAGTQPASFAQFGASVAVSGTTIVVGAWGYSGLVGPSFGGRAYVYTRDDEGQWGQVASDGEVRFNAELASDDLGALDLFGYAVAVHTNASGAGWIAVGASLQGATDQGAVYIFEGSGSSWSQRAKILPAAVAARDNFGSKVALGDRTLLAGVQNSDTEAGVNAGRAYVFRRGSEKVGSGTWSSEPTAALEIAEGNPGDAFGCSGAVSADGLTLAVGATGVDFVDADGTDSANGAVYVFAGSKGGAAWTRQATLLPREANANNAFGFSCDISSDGDEVVVGAPGYDASAINSGCAFAFSRTGTDWAIEPADLWTASALLNQAIGRSVSLSGDGQRATAGSEYPTANPSSVFAWTYDPTDPPGAPGGGTPPTPDAPGADQVAGGGGNSTGAPNGGTTPTTGLGGGGGSGATPLTPLVYPWGIARNSAIFVNDGARSIGLVPTDGLQRGGRTDFVGMGQYPEGLVPLGVADYNGDNSGDVIFLETATDRIKVWERDGSNWRSAAPQTVGRAPADAQFAGAGDFNSDGSDDLAWFKDGMLMFQLTSGGVVGDTVAKDIGAGSWRFLVSPALVANSTGGANQPSQIVAFDSGRGVARKLTVSSGGVVSDPQDLPTPGGGWSLSGFGDVNRDSTPDTVWTEGDQGREWRFMTMRADGTASSTVRWDSQKRGWRLVTIVDWDGNGTVDPMLARDEYLIVLLNQWNTQASGFGYITTPGVAYIQESVPDGFRVLGFGDR